MRTFTPCPVCNGAGHLDDNIGRTPNAVCLRCGGIGRIVVNPKRPDYEAKRAAWVQRTLERGKEA